MTGHCRTPLHTELMTGWRGLSDQVMAYLEAPAHGLLIAAMGLGFAGSHAELVAAMPVVQAKSFTTWHD